MLVENIAGGMGNDMTGPNVFLSPKLFGVRLVELQTRFIGGALHCCADAIKETINLQPQLHIGLQRLQGKSAAF